MSIGVWAVIGTCGRATPLVMDATAMADAAGGIRFKESRALDSDDSEGFNIGDVTGEDFGTAAAA